MASSSTTTTLPRPSNNTSSSRSFHGHVILFYRYFLPSASTSSSNDDAAAKILSESTLRYLHQHSSYYLPKLQQYQTSLCHKLGNMKGRILISTEGINGTLSCHTKDYMMEYICVMEQFDLISELGLPPPSSSSSSSSSVEHHGKLDDNESSSPATEEDEEVVVVVPKPHSGRLFANIDWKTSTCTTAATTTTTTDPFPDLKIQIVNEIVNTGGTIHVNDIPTDTGKEISAEEFHNILLDAMEEKEAEVEEEPTPPLKRAKVKVDDDDTIIQNKKEKKEVVLIDVRNTFEHAIGHFVHPHLTTANNRSGISLEDDDNNIDGNNEGNKNQEAPTTSSSSNNPTTLPNHPHQQQQPKPAINPNTVTFSHFDSTFCSQYSESLKDKKVLMYCTGGIRCVKASAMLTQRGVQDVSHLSGGIHRYLEKYGNNGFYKGKMFVFDQRIALDAGDMMLKRKEEEEVDDVGGGEDNSDSGDNAVASKAALDGTKSNEQQQQKTNDVVGKCIECNNPYDEISGANLCTVCRDLLLICPSCRDKLVEFHCERHQTWKGAYFTFLERYTTDQLQYQKDKLQVLHDSCPPKKHKNVRNTIRKQMNKIDTRINDIVEGKAVVEPNAKRRCRTCFESNDICDGRCWGFWRQSQAPKTMTPEPIVEVKIGDRVTIGPNWNQTRLGYKDVRLLGTVTNIKSWTSGGDELDCVAVKWDTCNEIRRRNSPSSLFQSEIYRWGVVARNGQRMYDVKQVSMQQL